ncbi:MAG: hypothetical protein V3T22_00150, partial [Planctomycetota bacterium]
MSDDPRPTPPGPDSPSPGDVAEASLAALVTQRLRVVMRDRRVLGERMTVMEQTLREREAELEGVREQSSAARSGSSSDADGIAALQDADGIAALQTELAVRDSTIESLRSEVSRGGLLAAEFEDNVDRLTRELERSRSEVQNAGTAAAEESRSMDQAAGRLASLEAELSTREAAVERMHGTIGQLEDELASVRATLARDTVTGEAQVADYESRLEHKDQELSTGSEENLQRCRNLEEKLAGRESALELLRAKLAQAEVLVTEHEAGIQSLDRERAQGESERARLEDGLAVAARQVAAHAESLEAVNEELLLRRAERVDDASAWGKERDLFPQDLAESEGECAQGLERIAELQENLGDSEVALDALRADLETATTRAARHEGSLESLNQDLVRRQSEQDERAAGWNAERSELEEQLASQGGAFEELRVSLTEAEGQVTEYEGSLESLSQELMRRQSDQDLESAGWDSQRTEL